MTFEIGYCTDVGRRRTGNEDSLDVIALPLATVCVVADGMGGHQAGEVASAMAVTTMRHELAGSEGEAAERLERAVALANAAIYAASEEDIGKRGMGTTVVCAFLDDSRVVLANVGDSPAYLVSGGEGRQITDDHSWVAEELARGAVTAEEAATHPYRHILTRCLGVTGEVEVQHYPPFSPADGDVLVLASDGLSEHVEPTDLPGVITGRSAQQAAEALVALANERGGSDNISVIVVRWGGAERTPVRDDTTLEMEALPAES